MSKGLVIDATWEHLEFGAPEERACFAAIGISCHGLCLTEAEDAFVKIVRQRVNLSGYRLAEWLAWNWWRLRWEPRKRSTDWAMAHRMSAIGGGYVWPNITISSDGERVLLLSEPTQPRPAEPLRYISNVSAVVQANELDEAVDAFVEQVRERLAAEKVESTNLDAVWNDLLADRANPDATLFRKFEALLGKDPDEADPAEIDSLIEDSKHLGQNAMAEIAASSFTTAASLAELAHSAGAQANLKDAVRLDPAFRQEPPFRITAWRRGAEVAQALRSQKGLRDDPVSDLRLCQMAGVPATTLDTSHKTSPLSFALDEAEGKSRVVLRSRHVTGRRFALARLIGDRLTKNDDDHLLPATNAFTYRQRQQRAFAAELLCPFEPLADHLKGDFSTEAVEDAADHFRVSERVVLTILVNHKLLDREALDAEEELAAA